MIHLKQVVIATDLSSNSLSAVQYGCSLASQFGADVHLLHIVNYPFAEFARASQQNFCRQFDEYEKQQLEAAEKSLGEISVEPLVDADRVTRVARNGFPVTDIPHYVEESQSDLLVVGTHGWTGLKHALMGSVCEAVARRAKCPVLSVRAN